MAVFVTFRLADSLPRELLDHWLRAREAFLAANPPPWDDITEACYHGLFSDKIGEHLDAAHGSCALRDPHLAQIVADRLHHFDGQRYDLWGETGSGCNCLTDILKTEAAGTPSAGPV